MRLGSDQVKTPDSRSSAWLSRVTLADHRPVSFRLELANAGHPDYGRRQPVETTVSRTSTSPFVGPVARALVRWELTKGAEVETGVDYFTLLDTPEEGWRIVNLVFRKDG